MIKKELFIFLLLFLILALGMHMPQWITHPIEHIQHLAKHKMPYHPLLYTFLLYLLFGLFRFVFHLIKKLFRTR